MTCIDIRPLLHGMCYLVVLLRSNLSWCVFFIAFCVRMKAAQSKEATSRTTSGGTRRLQNLPASAGTRAIAVLGRFVFID